MRFVHLQWPGISASVRQPDLGTHHDATWLKAPVAQLDRALPSEGRGQRFESSRVRHYTPELF